MKKFSVYLLEKHSYLVEKDEKQTKGDDAEAKKKFNALLVKYKVKDPSELSPKDKSKFFQEVDKGHKSDDEQDTGKEDPTAKEIKDDDADDKKKGEKVDESAKFKKGDKIKYKNAEYVATVTKVNPKTALGYSYDFVWDKDGKKGSEIETSLVSATNESVKEAKVSEESCDCGKDGCKECAKLDEAIENIFSAESVTESMDNAKRLEIYNQLKKGDKVEVMVNDAMSGKGKRVLVVTANKRVVGKAKVERITLKNVENMTGAKYYLYFRNGNVSLAHGDMAASMDDINIIKESVVVEGVNQKDMDNFFGSNYKSHIDKLGSLNMTGLGEDYITSKDVASDDEDDVFFAVHKWEEMNRKRLGLKDIRESESITESFSDGDVKKIKDAYKKKGALMGLSSDLKKLGYKDVEMEGGDMIPYHIKIKKGKDTYVLVNKKYATKPDWVEGDIAGGLMESRKSDMIKVDETIVNEKSAIETISAIYKKAHGDKYDQAIVDKMVKDLKKKYPKLDDEAIVGIAQNSLAEELVNEESTSYQFPNTQMLNVFIDFYNNEILELKDKQIVEKLGCTFDTTKGLVVFENMNVLGEKNLSIVTNLLGKLQANRIG